MRTLAIDIETYSSADLKKTGVYKYTEAPDFTVLMFAYSFDDEPVEIFDLVQRPGNIVTDEIRKKAKKVYEALTDPNVLKTAFNANFERTCLSKFYGIHLPVEQWQCTMIRCAMLGFPMALEMVAKVLKLEQQKDNAGKALIRYFSLPCKPTEKNGKRFRNLPEHDIEKWEAFKNYCVQDVIVERTISTKLGFFEIPVYEQKLWCLDQRINDGGVLLDPQFVKNAIQLDIDYREKLTTEVISLTNLDNPNSAAQLKRWLTAETGTEVTKLTKEAIPGLLADSDSDVVTRVLQIRQEMAKTSVKKYEAMHSAICADNRVRGLLQYYGANRTGRWAGRLVQVQNLPQNHLPDLDLARQLVATADMEMLMILFGNVPDTLSQLIRTAFVAPKGHRFIVADFSAIEARVIAWLAGERWRMEVFNTHGKIYEASAAQMFKVPIEAVTKGSPLRQKGKVSELALGYQGAAGALEKMGALKMGIPLEELPKLVAMWRNANKAIVKLWQTVQDAAFAALDGETVTIQHGIKFFVSKNMLNIQLPSGRKLCYLRPKIVTGRNGFNTLTYEGMNQTTKTWGIQETYGGKLVENIVQAIARDCLADSMLRLDAAGYNIVMHVHDEVVLDMHIGEGSEEDVNAIMSQPIAWAKGLPLAADSYETFYYKKD